MRLPLLLEGVVEAIHEGDVHAETEVVVRVGSIKVIVTKKRKPYHKEKDFTQLGLNPRKADILVVKIGYLVPELYDMRGDWIMALDSRRGGSGYGDAWATSESKGRCFPLDKDHGKGGSQNALYQSFPRTLKHTKHAKLFIASVYPIMGRLYHFRKPLSPQKK